MKAFLLAGGRGERLRPLTEARPKCLVAINGVPLLDIWLALCAREGIAEVLLNVSHHVDAVRNHLASRSGPPAVTLVVENEPQGTAGTVRANDWFVAGDENFWILYADNLTNASLRGMLGTHRGHHELLTMGLFRAPDPRAAGIVQMETDGRIVSFDEKPVQPRGDLANAGIYVARAGLLAELARHRQAGVFDFGFHVLPSLVGRMHGHVIEQFLMDIGTPSALAAASAAWSTQVGRNTP